MEMRSLVFTLTLSLALLSASGCARRQPSGTVAPLSAPAKQGVAQGKTSQGQAGSQGDIPDTQTFVRYESTSGGYTIDAPEGWSRVSAGSTVTFVDRFDGEKIAVSVSATRATVVDSAALARAIRTSNVAARDIHVKRADLPSGTAMQVAFTSDSQPDPVTGKQIRLEDNAYFFQRGKHRAVLTLWAPLGADNVDQWRRISRSFRFR